MSKQIGEESETMFHKFMVKYPEKVCKKKLTIIDSEYRLYPIATILSAEYNSMKGFIGSKKATERAIGKIDVLFMYSGKRYLAEIKGKQKFKTSSMRCYWYATKILGYKKWYVFQNSLHLEPKKFKPAIILPRRMVNYEMRALSGMLGITLFSFFKKGKEFRMEIV